MKKLTLSTLTLAAALGTAHVAQGAVVFAEFFGDTTLETGLTAVNSPTIAGGTATLNGSNANNTASGFRYTSTFPGSYIMEGIISSYDGSPTGIDTIFAISGSIVLRHNNGTPGNLEVTSYDGTVNNTATIGSAATILAPGNHIALVISDSATAGQDKLRLYVNGVQMGGEVTSTLFNSPSIDVFGYGLEVHPSANNSRGFDGGFDAIALSTWDGNFANFSPAQFAIPEPSITMLGGLGILALFRRRR